MHNFSLGTFNVRGLCDELEKENLADDLERHKIDVCCIQETKIKDGVDITTRKGHRLICLQTKQNSYGNGFMVAKRLVPSINKYWKISDRISVLQLVVNAKNSEENIDDAPQNDKTKIHRIKDNMIRKAKSITHLTKKITEPSMKSIKNRITEATKEIVKETRNLTKPRSNLSSEAVSDVIIKLKYRKQSNNVIKNKSRRIISIINVYAPHSQMARQNPMVREQLYEKLNETVQNMSNSSSSILFIAGDFNAEVGKKEDMDMCLGRYSRGIRNDNGQQLINFCESNQLFVSNSSFQHPAKHQTTWEQKRDIPLHNQQTGLSVQHGTNNTQQEAPNKRTLITYKQIDYILVNKTRKVL